MQPTAQAVGTDDKEEHSPGGAKENTAEEYYFAREGLGVRSNESVPMTVLLDNGIFSHSEFAEPAVMATEVIWRRTHETVLVNGIRRKAQKQNPELQTQIETLPTIGRLIREGAIKAYEYREIWCERMRYRPALPFGHALRDCEIETCNAPLERTKFASAQFGEYFAKGGKKDRKKGLKSNASQISFFKFLCRLDPKTTEALVSNAETIRLTDFEVETLRNIRWFQFMCDRCGSDENYPDIFHLWTAERNRLEAFLTLDNRLRDLVSRVRNEKRKTIEIRTDVLRPWDLLNRLGIERLDPPQLQHDRFYHLHEQD